MNGQLPELCNVEGCRKLRGHQRNHDLRPTEAWDYFDEKDKNKLAKAGFATPRGGAKGGYQNHVVRSSKVIIPFERLDVVDLNLYQNGYVIRLLPEQYFEAANQPRAQFLQPGAPVIVGQNAEVFRYLRSLEPDRGCAAEPVNQSKERELLCL